MGKLTQHATLLCLIQDTLRVNASLQVTLRDNTQIKVLGGHLAHKLEVLLKALDAALAVVVVVVELHAGVADLFAGTDAEAAHAAAVQVDRADGVKVQEQAVVGVGRVGDVPAVGLVVVHLVEGGRVFDAEGPVRVLTVQALLVPVDHGLPVEAPGVFDRAPVREPAEVVARQELEERRREPLVKGRRRRVDG